MILGVALTLPGASTVFAQLQYIEELFPGAEIVSRLIDVSLSLALISLLLALLFRYVPDAEISWRDTTIGAVGTALLFTAGKCFIGLYPGRAGVGSAHGAAGSAVVFMVWVYYAPLILFFGAEITKSVARHRGRPLVHACPLDRVDLNTAADSVRADPRRAHRGTEVARCLLPENRRTSP